MTPPNPSAPDTGSKCVCGICLNESWEGSELHHLPLYVNGSEGIHVCPDCRLAITDIVRSMRSVGGRARRATYIAIRAKSQEGESNG